MYFIEIITLLNVLRYSVKNVPCTLISKKYAFLKIFDTIVYCDNKLYKIFLYFCLLSYQFLVLISFYVINQKQM